MSGFFNDPEEKAPCKKGKGKVKRFRGPGKFSKGLGEKFKSYRVYTERDVLSIMG